MHLRVAAEAGLAAAQCTLGVRYRLGEGGVSQDFAEARKWYQLAADQGNSAAMGNLAELYEKGLGVTKDPIKTLQWRRRAKEQDARNRTAPIAPPWRRLPSF